MVKRWVYFPRCRGSGRESVLSGAFSQQLTGSSPRSTASRSASASSLGRPPSLPRSDIDNCPFIKPNLVAGISATLGFGDSGLAQNAACSLANCAQLCAVSFESSFGSFALRLCHLNKAVGKAESDFGFIYPHSNYIVRNLHSSVCPVNMYGKSFTD